MRRCIIGAARDFDARTDRFDRVGRFPVRTRRLQSSIQPQVRLLQIQIGRRIAAMPNNLTRNRIGHQTLRDEIIRNRQPRRFGNRRQVPNDELVTGGRRNFFNPEVVRDTVAVLQIYVRPIDRRGVKAGRTVVRFRNGLVPADRVADVVIRRAAQRTAEPQRNRRALIQ